MMWFFLSLYFAIWTSIGVLISKRIMKTVSPQIMAGTGIFVVPFLFAIVFLTIGIPKVDNIFWLGVFMTAVINVFANLFSFTAIKYAPISLISPMSSFNPVFTTIFASFFLKEIPTSRGLVGIVIIVLGAYLLSIADIKRGLLEPFKTLFSNRYVLYFLLANVLWAITPIFEKTAIIHTQPTSPALVVAVGGSLLVFFMLPIILKTVKNPIGEVKSKSGLFLLLGPFSALALWAAFTAYSIANLGYVTAIFKLSVLFTILWGWLFFHEERIKERLLGATIMLLGTIFLVI